MSVNHDTQRGLGLLLADVSRLLRRDFDRRVRHLGMTQAQWRALAHLSNAEGINQAALAERLEVTPITIARLVDRMEAAGWVRREPCARDRRASLLYLTTKAKPILDEIDERATESREAMLDGIPAGERRQLAVVLERMKANLLDAGAASVGAADADAAMDAANTKQRKQHGRENQRRAG